MLLKNNKILLTNLIVFLFIAEIKAINYQEILINNEVVEPGARISEDRYQAIKNVLNKYERPFTVLGIGAAEGYFSLRTAYDFDCVAVMIEGGVFGNVNMAEKLLDICKKNTLISNIIFLEKKVNYLDLIKLANYEHFDVVFALNIMHHFGNKWRETADAIFNLGDNIIVESPSYAPKELEEYLKSKKHIELGKFKRGTNAFGTIRWYQNDKIFNISPENLSESNTEEVEYLIDSNFKNKIVYKLVNGKEVSSGYFVSGISLSTFKFMNGVWPSMDSIESVISKNFATFENLSLYDIKIQGQRISLNKLGDKIIEFEIS